jgi:hypothetical protein
MPKLSRKINDENTGNMIQRASSCAAENAVDILHE